MSTQQVSQTNPRGASEPLGLPGLSRGGAGGWSGNSGAMPVPRPAARWRTRVLVPLVVLLGGLGVLGYAARDVLTPAVEVRVAPVIVKEGVPETDAGSGAGGGGSATPAVGAIARAGSPVQAPGWIEPDPFAIGVPAFVDGTVSEVLALDGQRVEKGQVVARLVNPDLELAVRMARAELAEKTADVARARVGVDRAKAGVAAMEAEAAAMLDEVTRKRDLVAAGGVSPGEFRRLELKLDAARAATAQARAEVQVTEAEIEQAAAAEQTARAALDLAELHVTHLNVVAPSAGVVLAVTTRPGMRMSMNTAVVGPGSATGSGVAPSAEAAGAVMLLYDPEKLQVRVDVPLGESGKLAVGTRAEITTDAVPNHTFEGEVSRIVHEANIQRNTVQFKVRVKDPVPQLRPEVLARVRFLPGATAGAAAASGGGTAVGSKSKSGSASPVGTRLLLPVAAVVGRHHDQGTVWLAVPTAGARGMVAKRADVTVGDEADGEIEIVSGVRPGDRAILDPPGTLSEGTRVVVSPIESGK